MNLNKIIWLGIVISCGSTIKKTIQEEYPKEYKLAMKSAPWYLKWNLN